MNQFKKAKVIMLPIINGILFMNRYNKMFINDNYTNGEAYEIYITSDDKIELGDCYYRPGINEIFKGSGFIETDKKVISSTEKLNDLPQPSEEFIEKYIEAYNRNEVITDILVEYEGEKSGCLNSKGNGGTQCDMPCDNAGWCPDNRDKLNLKINQDNTINIGLLKDSWTREEVESKLFELLQDITNDETLLEHYAGDYREFNNWIKENL